MPFCWPVAVLREGRGAAVTPDGCARAVSTDTRGPKLRVGLLPGPAALVWPLGYHCFLMRPLHGLLRRAGGPTALQEVTHVVAWPKVVGQCSTGLGEEVSAGC